MRRRYRPYGGRSYTVGKFYYADAKIDFTNDNLDYNHFLLQEFFNADTDTISKIFKYYDTTYGARALSYLDRKFDEWAKGDYHLTDMMRERILSMMPKFLNHNAKYKLGVYEFMGCIKNTVKKYQLKSNSSQNHLDNIDDFVAIIEKEYEKINSCKVVYKNRFNVLTTNELIEAEDISKFILFTKLETLTQQIESDFNNFLPYTNQFKKGKVERSYSIPLLGIQLDLKNFKISNVELPITDSTYQDTNNRFRIYAERYLAYELTEVHKSSNLSTVSSFLNLSDLELLVERYLQLVKSKLRAKILSKFNGQAGLLTIRLNINPPLIIVMLILASIAKLIFYPTAYFFLMQWMFSPPVKGASFFIGIISTIAGYYLIQFEFNNFKALIEELKSYGQQ